MAPRLVSQALTLAAPEIGRFDSSTESTASVGHDWYGGGGISTTETP
jgi:hypothetical protein